jgi:ankyrin repeat protein
VTYLRCGQAAIGAIAVCAVTLSGGAQAEDSALFAAVRNDDSDAVRTLLKAGVDANTRDVVGATALMNAAAFSSVNCLRVLVDGGADVNAPSNGGGTALMWATGDLAKVRLLLDRGAVVNASAKDGSTALLVAARRGNTDVMRLLLARRADPSASANAGAELLRIAYAERPETRQTLANAGIEPKDLVPSGAPSLANYPVSNTGAIRALLDMGASPNPRGRFPLLALATVDARVDTVRLLLERGADPNAKGQHDVTALMMAAAASGPNPAIVRLLMAKGADPTVRDEAGRTALDWALLQGDTPVARLLRETGTQAATPPPLPLPPAATAASRTPRAAVTQALARLQPISPILYERRKCIACHHQPLPVVAMKLASARGIAVDAAAMAHPIQSILDVWNSRRDDLMLGRQVGGGANELTYGLLALAEAAVPPNSATDAAVANLASIQRTDGSWVFLDTRPPQADNSLIHFTAMAVRGLDVYGPPGQREDIKTRIARAREFLRAASPASTQDEVFKLLGLVWSRVPTPEISVQSKRVVALQRQDGGWGQLPTMASDAYATGEALYALHASGLAAASGVYQKGVAYLLCTQLEDGTWFVRSRAFGFQPYFESGFPHGADQFISASATSWAAIALAYAL